MVMGKDLPLPESPQAKFWTWIVGIAVGSVALLLFADARWMARAEAQEKLALEAKERSEQIAQLNTAQQRQLETLQMQIEYSADQNAKRQIDAKLFELEQIPPQQLRPQDRALYSKLLRDRAELVSLWNRRGRPLR
jgi:hypothetical protein